SAKHGERAQPFIAVRLRFRLSAQDIQYVGVIERMAEAVDRRGLVTRRQRLLVLRTLVLELPVRDLADRDAAHPDRALFAEYGDAAVRVPRVGERGNAHGAERPALPTDAHYAGILGLAGASQGRGVGMHRVYRTDEPVQQVD